MSYNQIFALLLFTVFSTNLSSQTDTCTYQIQLIDFFGDGWDGATLTVVTPSDTSNYTLLDSTVRFVEIKAIQNEPLKIFFSEGLFDEEISYIVSDPDGNIIFNDGPNPKIGLVVDIIACPTCPLPKNSKVNASDNAALISWQAINQNAQYLLEYGKKGFTRDSGLALISTDTFIQLTDLEKFTNYEFYLSTICVDGDTSILAINDTFTTRYAIDVGIAAISMPTSACGLTNNERIEIQLKNFGGKPQSLIPFRFSVNGIDGGVMPPDDGFFTNILSKDSIAYLTFETTYDFSQPSIYEIAVWTELEGDNDLSNDTAYLQVNSIPILSNFPYSQNFETDNGNWLTENNNAKIGWQYGLMTDTLIPLSSGGQNGWQVHLDTNNINQQFFLHSPCLDFSDLATDPKIAFRLWLNTAEKLWLEISTNNANNWRRIESDTQAINWYNNDTENAWESSENFNDWVYVENVLKGAAKKENVRLRLVYESGTSPSTGTILAIDNLQIFESTTTNLVALSTKNIARLDCGIGADKVQLQIYNAGIDSLSNFTIQYQINDRDIITENIDIFTLKGQDMATFQFDTPFNSSVAGTYLLKTWIAHAKEALPLSDTVYYQFSVAPPLPLPLIEDFEDGAVDEGWFAVGGTGEIRAPEDHNNETHILALNLWFGAPQTAIHTATYGPIQAGDSLSFDYRYVLWQDGTIPLELTNDSFLIQISTDCGDSFTTIHQIDSTNHQTSTAFSKLNFDLSEYIGQNVQIRFVGIWGDGDYWLDMDNISILQDSLSTSINLRTTMVEHFRLFPNPTTGTVQFDLQLLENAERVQIEVVNTFGQIVLTRQFVKERSILQTLNLADFPKGIYFVTASVGNQTVSRKLIKVE